jgi:topoisomerase-4 subunit A
VQAEAILNMRLRSLRKLEEMEIKGEHKALSEEKDELEKLVKSEKKQWGKDQEAGWRDQEAVRAGYCIG